MSARTCQLCGKPLSRLRVGGDSDFCSREHRNQHRLRRGMDRLEEANKVTSLMRRRENPRQISAARLMCNSASDRRGFFQSKTPAAKELAAFSPVLRNPAALRITGTPDRYAAPRPAQMAGTDTARWADASRIRITGYGTAPQVPPRRQRLLTQIAQARLAAFCCDSPAPRAVRREFGMHRGGEQRIHLDAAALAPGRLEPRSAMALIPRTQAFTIRSGAVEGNALRVSIGIGFRPPAVNSGGCVSRASMSAGLVWPGTPRPVLPEGRNLTGARRSLGVELSEGQVRLPVVNSGGRRARFDFPGSVPARNRRPAEGPGPAKRTTDVAWRPPEPRLRGVAVDAPTAGFAKRNGAHLSNIVLAPTTTYPLKQVAFAAFIPQEPVGCPRVEFEGTVAAAIAGGTPVAGEIAEVKPAAPAEPAPVHHIEEHFGDGWENWVGGMKDWRVDVAGVRTGPLALFVPTMELIDYELSFLARIDTRSLCWVVRASGLDEYLRCTLTAVAGGELELSRCAVIGGVARETVVSTQRIPGKPRSAMTVNTQTAGDTFTVSVDGNDIDSWVDDRFPMGGIGFTGAPDDRARLYWVRLSSSESTAKEHQNK